MRLHDVDLSDPDAFNDGIPHDDLIDGIKEMPVRFTPEAN